MYVSRRLPRPLTSTATCLFCVLVFFVVSSGSTEVEDAARRLGLKLYRTCVRDNTNVTEVFEYLTTEVLVHGDSGGGAIANIEDIATGGVSSPAAAGAGAGAGASAGGAEERKTGDSPAPRTPLSSAGDAVSAPPARPALQPSPESAVASPPATRTPRHRTRARAPKPADLVSLAPSKVRTGNKKGRLCAIL